MLFLSLIKLVYLSFQMGVFAIDQLKLSKLACQHFALVNKTLVFSNIVLKLHLDPIVWSILQRHKVLA